jgi:type I restriction enzyme M protein
VRISPAGGDTNKLDDDAMTEIDQKQLGRTLWNIADTLRGAMNADDFRDYMLSFLFLRYLSDNYESAAKKELGSDYPEPKEDDKGGRRAPLAVWSESRTRSPRRPVNTTSS